MAGGDIKYENSTGVLQIRAWNQPHEPISPQAGVCNQRNVKILFAGESSSLVSLPQ